MPVIADLGYSVERCRSGLGAATALAAGMAGANYWETRIRFWEAQLAHAQARSFINEGRSQDGQTQA